MRRLFYVNIDVVAETAEEALANFRSQFNAPDEVAITMIETDETWNAANSEGDEDA